MAKVRYSYGYSIARAIAEDESGTSWSNAIFAGQKLICSGQNLFTMMTYDACKLTTTSIQVTRIRLILQMNHFFLIEVSHVTGVLIIV